MPTAMLQGMAGWKLPHPEVDVTKAKASKVAETHDKSHASTAGQADHGTLPKPYLPDPPTEAGTRKFNIYFIFWILFLICHSPPGALASTQPLPAYPMLVFTGLQIDMLNDKCFDQNFGWHQLEPALILEGPFRRR